MKQLQQQNKQNVDLLSAYFQHRSEPNYAWSRACSMYLALPALRGFWPMSTMDYTAANRCIDLSGQGNHLTENGTANQPTWNYAGLAPYTDYDITDNQYFSRVDGGAGNWADILGTEAQVASAARGLTFGGWFWFDAIGVQYNLIGKFGAGVNRSYLLQRRNTNAVRIFIGDAGGVLYNQEFTASTTVASQWYFVIGRFDPSTSLDIFLNDEYESNVVGLPAAIADSNVSFTIGTTAALGTFFDGRASMCFLCAAYLSDAIILSLFEQTRAMYNV